MNSTTSPFTSPFTYAYVGNNPMRSTDPFGLWETPDHIDMSNTVLENRGFTPEDLRIVWRAHWWVDTVGNIPFLNEKAHCMPGTGTACEEYIQDYLDRAIQLMSSGCRSDAIWMLTLAIHAAQDRYAHEGNTPPGGWGAHARSWFSRKHISPDDKWRHRVEYEKALIATSRMVDRFQQEVAKARSIKPASGACYWDFSPSWAP